MKTLTILTLCLFFISISVLTFAADPAQVKQPVQKIETEAAELIKEAKALPSTLITDETEESKVLKAVEELKEGYVYDEDPSD